MTTTYTIDASVFINAFNSTEPGHTESKRLLAAHLRDQAAPLIAPTLLLPEVAATIRRGQGNEELARRFAATLGRLPNLVLKPLDQILAQQAGDIAARYNLRGNDAIYATVALRFGSILVSLDQNQRESVAAALQTCTPAQALADLDLD